MVEVECERVAYVSGQLFAGQKTGITATPVALALGQPGIREVLIQADPSNTTNLKIGSATSQFVQLTPGQAISVPIHGLDTVFVAMVSGTGIANWLARD
jgi:hypothetical protein